MDDYTYAYHEGVMYRTNGGKIQKRVYDEITGTLKLEEFIELLRSRTVHLDDVFVYPEQWQYEEDESGACIRLHGWEDVFDAEHAKVSLREFS